MNRRLKNMTKAEIITLMAKKAGISKQQAQKALEAYMEVVKKGPNDKELLKINSFTAHSVAKGKAKNGLYPQTRKIIKISSKKVVKFKAGKKMPTKVK